MFITLSTILVPITTGLKLSLTLEYPRLTAGTELPLTCSIAPLGGHPLEGEHDCRLGLPVGPGSTEEDRELGAPGLPLVAESGLSGSVVLKFGGASSENPGISEGFHGLDFTVEEAPRDGTEFLNAAGVSFVTEGDDLIGGADILGALDGVDGRRVGVAALDTGLDEGIEGLAVGAEDLAVDLVGVEDLAETAGLVAEDAVLAAETVSLVVDVTGFVAGLAADVTGLVEEIEGLVDGNVARVVGVDDLVGLDAPVKVGRPVSVAGLEPGPPDDEGLRIPVEFNPGDKAGCFSTKLPLAAESGWGFASYKHNEQNQLSISSRTQSSDI